LPRSLGACEARRAWQAAEVGRQVEVIAHAHLRVVADVEDALRPGPPQRRHAGARQIIGVDVVGVDVVGPAQRGGAALQTITRMTPRAVAGVDARHAQHGHAHAGAAAIRAQAELGVDTAACTVGGRGHGPGLVETLSPAVTVNAGRAGVHQSPHPSASRQGANQSAGARVGIAVQRRRRQVQHGIGQPAQPVQRGRLVQVAQQRYGSLLAQHGHAIG
jgi:hypothetical protein